MINHINSHTGILLLLTKKSYRANHILLQSFVYLNCNLKTVFLSLLHTSDILPLWSRIICRERLSPTPVPSCFVV